MYLTEAQHAARNECEDLILSGASPDDDRVKALELIFDPRYYIQMEGCPHFERVSSLALGDEYPNVEEDECGSVVYAVRSIEYSAEARGMVGYCSFVYSTEDTEIESDEVFGSEEVN